MNNLNNLRQELKNKERTVNDLIRYISTRTDNNPNYSLLLGAGCSVTSGIRSANQLITKWEKELYLQLNNLEEDNVNAQEIREFFSSQMWYDSRNPYSSLFEKKYDLPRQRRMFVEQEVRDKIPSLGYAYLIKLVENNFFKTIFTTNFDDLLNEAFYQFSNQRPIVCAHDSSISSITITSKRPKIIKLHGDYLFDDIKSTLRETESLEENIKNKFIEFSKDYGLIVIGYGGNDRSIVDILTYLLKNEEYFKHGIYWCLRESSIISEDLRKLLWKEKVYYVSISGFDEFFAEVHSKLNDGGLPIDNSYLNKKTDNLIDNIVNNDYLKKSECSYIRSDLKKLVNTKEKEIISNFLQYLDSKEESEKTNASEFAKKTFLNNKDLSDSESEVLLTINNDLFLSHFESALKLIEEEINKLNINSSFYYKLLSKKGKCLRELDRKSEAFKVYKKLLEKDSQSIQLHLILSDLCTDLDEKLKYIDKAMLLDEFSSELINKKILTLLEYQNDNVDRSNEKNVFEELNSLTDKSLSLYPAYDNSAWKFKFELLEKNIDEKNIDEFEKNIKLLESQDPTFPEVVRRKVQYLNLNTTSKEKIDKYLIDIISKTKTGSFLKHNEFQLLEHYSKTSQNQKILERFDYLEKTYFIDNAYLYKKSDLLLSNFDMLIEAIDILRNIQNRSKHVNKRLFQLILYSENFEEAKQMIKDISNDNYLLSEYYMLTGNLEEALKYLDFELSINPNSHSYVMRKSFLYLKQEEYLKAYKYLDEKLKLSNFTDQYLLVNYFVASKYRKRNVREQKIKSKLLDVTKDNKVKAAAYALIDDIDRCTSMVKSIIKKNYEEKYAMKHWVVFKDMMQNSKFREMFMINDKIDDVH